MRIAIDARAFSWAGVGRYTRNLLAYLARVPNDHEYTVLVGASDHKFFAEFKDDFLTDKFREKAVEGSYYSWREQLVFWRQLENIEADLFHFTHFNVPVFFSKPYAVTVHDVTRFIFPGQTRQGLFKQVVYEQVFKRAVERARDVICVSQTTASDLKNLPLKAINNIHVIYEGVAERFTANTAKNDRQRVKLMIGSKDPYLLYVGVWMEHKNIKRILLAYASLLRQHPRLKLVMTGRPKPGYVGVDKIARSLGLGNGQVIYAGFVPHELLPALYAEATCLVFPSLYEGFGLPALEAAACGTPVVASNVSSLPEILGEAAEYVNPEYVPGIAAGIERVLSDEARRKELQRLGVERAGQFSWEKCARETLAVYGGAANKN